MTWLRNVLDDVADGAPEVDLTERTIRTCERRRRRTVPIVAAAAVFATALAATATVQLLPAKQDAADGLARGTVADLPARGVEPLSHAFMTLCPPADGKVPPGCVDGGWRVVTRSGTTYRVPQAWRAPKFEVRSSPLVISQDGRKIAYYNAGAGFVVRDLASGAVQKAPYKMPKTRLDGIGPVLLSDDGRFLAVGALKDRAMLFDMRDGVDRPLPSGWNPIGLSPDGDTITLTQYAPKRRLQTISHLWQKSTAKYAKTVDLDGDYVVGGLSPDGKTIAAVGTVKVSGTTCMRSGKDLVRLDRETGKVIERIPVRGLSMTGNFVYLRGWTGPQEITALATPFECKKSNVSDSAPSFDPSYVPITAYAVNVETGEARKLDTYTAQDFFYLVLPGFPGML